MSKKSNRSWWRGHFADHPGIANKNPDAIVASETGITKVTKLYCKACFPVGVNWVMDEDARAATEGRITTVRSEAEVEAHRESIN